MTAKRTLSLQRGFSTKKAWIIGAIIVALVAFVVAGYFLAKSNGWFASKNAEFSEIHFDKNEISTKEVSDKDKDSYSVSANDPRILTIPSIGVRARVAAIGALSPNTDGSQQLDAPKSIYDTGWYNCQINPIKANRCATTKRPGDGNTSVADFIDGHSCEGYSAKCVFDDLAKLKEDDKLTVELGNGTKVNYTIKKVATVALSDVNMSQLLKPITTGKEGLNLLTCAGDWTSKDSRGDQTPDQRVEVFAIRD